MNFGTRRALDRLADDAGHFRMLAVDQRPPVFNLVADALGIEQPLADEGGPPDPTLLEAVKGLKQLLVETLAPHASAVLVDPITAFPGSAAVSPRQGMIMTLEHSVFESGPGGRRTSAIADWSVDKIKRIGADGVKFLAWYRPDAAPDVIEHQQQLVATTAAACRHHDIPFVFELLLYPFPGETVDPTFGGRRAEMVIESVETFAPTEFGVDVFKLESPVAPSTLAASSETEIQSVFDALGRAAGRPWVLLSGGAEPDVFLTMLRHSYRAGASGFLAGRSIWWDAVQYVPDLDKVRLELESNSTAFLEQINELTTEHARSFRSVVEPRPPWDDVPSRYAGT